MCRTRRGALRCEDDFNPLEGFAVSPLYADFSTPCFDGLHTVRKIHVHTAA